MGYDAETDKCRQSRSRSRSFFKSCTGAFQTAGAFRHHRRSGDRGVAQAQGRGTFPERHQNALTELLPEFDC